MTVAAIIQARCGSTRLPGKVLRLLPRTPAINGKGGAPQTILAHVINRAQAIPGVDVVCVATTEREDDDRIVRLARAAGARVVRGPEHDVLGRYALAAQALGADVIIRLTADCPLLDPLVAVVVLRAFENARPHGEAIYASNVHPPSWYDGADIEILSRDALETAVSRAGDAEREHVTTWMVAHLRRVNVACPGGRDDSTLKLSVDTAADLVRVRRTFAALSDRRRFGWRDVLVAYHRAHPHPALIRARRIFGNRRASQPYLAAFIAGGRDAAANRSPDPPRDGRERAYRLGWEDVAELGHAVVPEMWS